MQTLEREAGQLVRQFHAAPPQKQTHAAIALVEFCNRQPRGREWRDACGRVGFVTAIALAVNIGDAPLQRNAIRALGDLMLDHRDNQSAAAAVGAMPLLLQLTTSRNAALQQEAVRALGFFVEHHHDNQSDAGAARVVPHLVRLMKSSNTALQKEAVITLGCLVDDHINNKSAAAAEGVINHLLQLIWTKSSKSDLRKSVSAVKLQAVGVLGQLVNNHRDNQSAAAEAGAIPHLLQLTKPTSTAIRKDSGIALFQQYAGFALGCLVEKHHGNQSAAAAAGAIPHMVQLTKSSNSDIQGSGIFCLRCLVINHHANQSAAVAAGAIPHLLQLTKSSNAATQKEADLALGFLVNSHHANQEPACAAAASAATAPVSASARHLAPGSRVRIEGLQGRPEINGRTGVICGALEEAEHAVLDLILMQVC